MILCKTCTACLEIKPVTEFSKLKNGKYGRIYNCKICLNEFTTKFLEWCDDGLDQKNS